MDLRLGCSTTASSITSHGTQPSTPLAIITETAQQQIVKEMASVVRRELGVLLPRHLTPVLSALDEFRAALKSKHSCPPVEVKSHCNDRLGSLGNSPLPIAAKQDPQSSSGAVCAGHATDEADAENGAEYHDTGSTWRMGFLSSRQQKEGYQLLQSKDDELNMPTLAFPHDVGDDEYEEMTDPEAVRRLSRQILEVTAKKDAAAETLSDLQTHWRSRCAPYEEDLRNFSASLTQMQEELDEARKPRQFDHTPPGPSIFRFVDSTLFNVVCNMIVLLNLVSMALEAWFPGEQSAAIFSNLDNMFLAWYVGELGLKIVYHQRWLFCGECSVVGWNWLDLVVVACGVGGQWLLPLFEEMHGGHQEVNTSVVMILRTLRFFRVIRFLKILRAFLHSDLRWTEGACFECFMSVVIAANSLIMSLEVDIQWSGWVYVENFLQTVYIFELALRLKKQGCLFFTEYDSWNYLDFVMVVCGAMDLWLIPLVHCIQQLLYGGLEPVENSTLAGVFKLLTLMRLFRVLRLVKLLKMVKPLYRLLLGVLESVRAMQWVIVLTVLTLYACAVVFTNLVGKGLVTEGEISDEALRYFGSVPRSLFSLFKLMNGDLDVVEPIASYIEGQLLFAGFMVVTNWAVLAILTSVVSDNMISTSQKANEEDERKLRDEAQENRVRRLRMLFGEIDQDGDACISSSEWHTILSDPGLRHELLQATGLTEADAKDYFECLSEDAEQSLQVKALQESYQGRREKHLDYNMFIDSMNDDNDVADKRSILKVTSQLRRLENRMDVLLHFDNGVSSALRARV